MGFFLSFAGFLLLAYCFVEWLREGKTQKREVPNRSSLAILMWLGYGFLISGYLYPIATSGSTVALDTILVFLGAIVLTGITIPVFNIMEGRRRPSATN